MLKITTNIYADGKKSLETLLREKALNEVQEVLSEKGIEIDDVSDEDIEALVAAKVQDKMNGIKGFAMGSVFAFAVSLFIGV